MIWILVSILLFPNPLHAADFCSRLVSAETNSESVERVLRESPFIRLTRMKDFLESQGKRYTGSSEIYLVELQGGLRAVFKVDPDGHDADAEVAAYRFSEFLNVHLVPPTVPRTNVEKSGSLQLYVETGRDLARSGFREAFARMSTKDQSDVRLVQFILGKWDDHSGNLLIDDADRPIMIDNADIHMLQQARYGEFPYVKRGKRRASAKGDPGPFPFDSPSELHAPTLETLRAVFGPYWNEERLQKLHSQLGSIPNQTVRYAIWDGYAWLYNARTWRSPPHTETYSLRTLEALRRLNRAVLRSDILPASFSQAHIDSILDRTHQVLEASKKGELIP